MKQARPLEANEKQIIDRLLSMDFPGRDSVARQIESALVEQIDQEGSLKFHVESAERAEVKRRIPIEAECEDADGVMIHLLLHVVDGKVDELEIYKDDSSRPAKMPPASDFRLISLD